MTAQERNEAKDTAVWNEALTKIVLLDGGLGQELHKRSRLPAHPLWSLQVMRKRPELVQSVHEDFIRAGARVLTLNTYTATAARLARSGDLGWFEPLQEQAYDLAAAARQTTGCPFGPVQLAGCLPPLVGSFRSDLVPSDDECFEQYRAIVETQPKVDCFLCETMSSVREGRIAAEVALSAGKPVLLGFTVRDDGSAALRSGEPVEDMVAAVRELPLRGLLLNCSTPEAIRRALPPLVGSGLPFGAYANGFESVDALEPGGTVDVLTAREDLGPEEYATFALEWLASGATLLGGCCEVGPSHIRHLHEELVERGYSVTGL